MDLTYDLERFASFWVSGIMLRVCQSFPDINYYSLLFFHVGTNNAAWRVSKVTSSSMGSSQGHRGPHGVVLTPASECKGCGEEAADKYTSTTGCGSGCGERVLILKLWSPACGSTFAWERWDPSH